MKRNGPSYKTKEKYVPDQSTNNSIQKDSCGMDSSVCSDSQPNPGDSGEESLSGADSTIRTAYSLDDLSEKNNRSDERTSPSKLKSGNNNSTKNSNKTYKDTIVTESLRRF